jgi:hypothetical protein
MGFEAVGDDRHQKDVAGGAIRCFLADRPDEEVIGIEREVGSVVLDGTDGQHDDGLTPGHLLQLDPGVVLI